MDLAINNIHFNMQKHHRQFTTGISVTVIGALVTTIGIVITSNDPDDATGTGLAGTGSAITLAGSVITIDSHKWLGRGAWRRKNLYE